MINKRIIAAVIFLAVFSYQLNAQNPLKQGVYSLASAVSFSTAKNQGEHDKLNYTNFSLEPSFNYFVLDNLMIGGLVGYEYSQVEYVPQSGQNSKSINRSFRIGPSARNYFDSSPIIPFVGVSALYSKYIGFDQEGKLFSIEAGFNYFFSSSVALEPYVSYLSTSYDNPDQDVDQFSVGVRINYFVIK